MDPSEIQIPRPELPNSGAGIASVVIGLITLFLGAVVYSVWSIAISFAFSRQMMSATGASFSAMVEYSFLVHMAVEGVASVIGTVAAIVGLAQSGRRKDLAYVGLALNVILVLSVFGSFGRQYVLGF